MRSLDFGYDLGPVSGWAVSNAELPRQRSDPICSSRLMISGEFVFATYFWRRNRKCSRKMRWLSHRKVNSWPRKGGPRRRCGVHREAAGQEVLCEIAWLRSRSKTASRKSGRSMRRIVATGLIVEVAREAARPGEEQTVGIEAAKETVSERYRKIPGSNGTRQALDRAGHEIGQCHTWPQLCSDFIRIAIYVGLVRPR